MKWLPLVLIWLALTGSVIAQRLIPVEGASDNGRLICPRNPFWSSNVLNQCQGQFLVIITNPLNGSDMYFPSVTKNVTVTILESSTINSCQYMAGGAWNTFLNCGVGVNGTFDLVTFPEGYPVNLTVNITNDCGSVINSSEVYVWYTPTYGNEDNSVLAILGGMALIYLFWRYKRRKNEKKGP